MILAVIATPGCPGRAVRATYGGAMFDSISGDVTPGVFGPFSVDATQIRCRGVPMALGAEQHRILGATIAAAGEPVPVARLLALVDGAPKAGSLDVLWASVTQLNAALASGAGDQGYVAHFPGQGFALVIPRGSGVRPAMQPLPARLTTVIGCEDAVERIAERLLRHRFVTVVGAGGMGKTTAAVAAAASIGARMADGICFVDLAPLADTRNLPNVVAMALGVALDPRAAIPSLVAFLKDKDMLLVFDSCEHLVAAVASMAEELLRGAPRLLLLATSREPLLCTGEWLYRLGSMRMPPKTPAPAAVEAMAYPAVQLFVERAAARQPGYRLDDRAASQVSALCHQLDGIPLAIELAAARVALLGLDVLIDQVADRLLTATGGRGARTARHRTLAAMLDWSYDLLPASEAHALVRLSVFRGEFTLGAAAALLSEPAAGDAPGAPAQGADCVFELLSKSLVSRRDDAALCRYRLLDTTRAYAGAKLPAAARRHLLAGHARYLCLLLQQAEDDWLVMNRPAWLDRYKMWLDDIRVALDWTFAEGGDLTLGNALLIAAFPLAHQASLTAEFGERVALAMALAPRASVTASMLYPQLYALLCSVNAVVDPEDSGLAAAARAAFGAGAGNPLARYRTALATSMWAAAFIPGDFPTSLHRIAVLRSHADRDGDPLAGTVARRMQAQSLHFLGRHIEAQADADYVLANAWRRIPLVFSPSQVDVRVSMRVTLARIAFLGGRSTQARELALEARAHAAGDTAIALAQALSVACIPIALWCGDAASAQAFVRQLRDHAHGHTLHVWMGWANFYQDVLAHMDGDGAGDVRLMTPCTNLVENIQRDHLVTLCDKLIADDSLARVQAGTVAWCAPEMQRAQGERLARAGQYGAAAAMLTGALDTARAQAALAWELRAATSLASLWQQHARGADGRALLEPLVAWCTDGHETADLRRAHALLDRL